MQYDFDKNWLKLYINLTTNQENYEAAIKQIKMQGGVFGWVTDSNKFINAIKDA